MNKKTLLLGLCFLTGTVEVLARKIPLKSASHSKRCLNDSLLTAALEGDIPKMRNLIKAGADVNSQQFFIEGRFSQQDSYISTSNQTILIRLLSAQEVDLDVLTYLINEAGANPELKDSNGNNAFTLTEDHVDQELHDILNGKTKIS